MTRWALRITVFSLSFFRPSPRHHALRVIIIVYGWLYLHELEFLCSFGGESILILLNYLIGALCSQTYFLIANINCFKSRYLGLQKDPWCRNWNCRLVIFHPFQPDLLRGFNEYLWIATSLFVFVWSTDILSWERVVTHNRSKCPTGCSFSSRSNRFSNWLSEWHPQFLREKSTVI